MNMEDIVIAEHPVKIRPNKERFIQIKYLGIAGVLSTEDRLTISTAFTHFMRRRLPHRGLPMDATTDDLEHIANDAIKHLQKIYKGIHHWIGDLEFKVQ